MKNNNGDSRGAHEKEKVKIESSMAATESHALGWKRDIGVLLEVNLQA